MLIDVDFIILGFVRQTAGNAREKLVRVEAARLGLELIANLDINLRLLGLHHLHDFVGEHHALVRTFIETRIDDHERAFRAVERFQLCSVKINIPGMILVSLILFDI